MNRSKRAAVLLLASAWTACAFPADGPSPVSDTEIWNEGVEQYRAGDLTNAVRTLRPLMLSREYGPRAAEVVAKIAHDRAHTPGAEDALSALEEAAAAAQLALRASPGDPRAERNFTRAVSGLAELRETKRVNKALEEGKGKDPASILGEAARSARAMMAEAAAVQTNAAEVAVAMADSLSARADRLCDAWLQAKAAICQAVTNEEQAATISVQVDQARGRTAEAARALGDLSDGAYSAIAASEQDFTRFFKMTVLPPQAMREDLTAQSNAWLDVEAFNERDWQREALDYTRGFRSRFPAWAQAYEQRAAADTNMPPFTAEDQGRVAALAIELEKRQISCCETVVPPTQQECIELIRQILELLPKDGGGQGGAPQQQDQQSSQGDSRQQQDPKEQNPKEGENGSSAADEDNDGGRDEPERGDEAKDDEKGKSDDREVEALLRRAQERSDEHEAKKRERMRKAPLPPNERDW